MSIGSVNDCVMEKHWWHPRVPQGYTKDAILHTGLRFYYAYLDNILIASCDKNECLWSFVIVSFFRSAGDRWENYLWWCLFITSRKKGFSAVKKLEGHFLRKLSRNRIFQVESHKILRMISWGWTIWNSFTVTQDFAIFLVYTDHTDSETTKESY